MAYSFTEKKRIRKSFAKRDVVLPVPFLLATQLDSYAAFLQANVAPDARKTEGLQAAFKSIFPIESHSKNARLEFVSFALGEPPFEEGSAVHARRRVALIIDLVAREAIFAAALDEVVQRHLIERRGAGERADVTARLRLVAVGAGDHRHRVPTDVALDPPLELAVARVSGLVRTGDRVDVGRRRRERQLDAAADRGRFERGEQFLRALGPVVL